MIEIRFHGRGGQGALTAARILAAAFWMEGKYSLVLPEFKSERRSAPVAVFLRVDEKPIVLRSKVYTPDYLLVLDPSLLRLKKAGILAGFKNGEGMVVANANKESKYLPLLAGRRIGIADVDAISQRYGLGPAALPATGAAILGAFAKLTGLVGLASILQAANNSDELPKKEDNLRAIMEAFNLAQIIEVPEGSEQVGAVKNISGLVFHDWRELPQSVISLGDTRDNLTGDWRRIRPVYETKLSPCKHACPLDNDIPYWVRLIEQGRHKEAWLRLIEKNPFPAVTGRVCPAFCEHGCNRKDFDEPISIRNLERFLGDTAMFYQWQPPITGKVKPLAVAVIGSGPAGLSCSYQLARQRFQVSIFEKRPVLGGLLYTGIPNFRLPKDVLAHEIDNILWLGVVNHTNVTVDARTLGNLIESNGYDAIFLATGLQTSRKLNIPGEENQAVLYGLDFLEKINLGEKVELGKKVIVIGGGNTALDVAITAKRLGSRDVAIFYRRTKVEMPAIKSEIEQALAEGITIRELVAPLRIFEKSLECQRMALGESDKTGRKKPIPIADSNFNEDFDHLIIAVGEEKTEFFETLANNQKVFVAHDAGTVSGAIGAGRKGAQRIAQFLLGGVREDKTPSEIVELNDLNLSYFRHRSRRTSPQLEAKRCFSCGVCNLCGNCWKFCPHMAISEQDGELKINYDYCKGCGVCWEECPRSIISKETEV